MLSEASLCNVSRAVWKLLASHSKPSHQLTSRPPFDRVTGMEPFAGSAIAQGVNRLEHLVRGFKSTKWLLLAGASDPPCKTSTRRARDCDRGSSFLRGVTNDLALMERSPMVKNSLHNTIRKGFLENTFKMVIVQNASPSLQLCQCHFW